MIAIEFGYLSHKLYEIMVLFEKYTWAAVVCCKNPEK